MNKSRVIWQSALQALTVLVISILTGQSLFSSLGVYLWGFTFFLYINQLGNTIPVIELMILIATSQWILGPVIDYNTSEDHFKYFMYVDENEYMAYVVPGTFFFVLAVLIKYPNQDLKKMNIYLRNLSNSFPQLAYYLVAIGIVSDFLRPFLPNTLSFAFYLLLNLKYVGVALLLFKTRSTQKWWLLIGVMFLTLFSSIRAGMFHDLILWSAMLLSFVALNLSLSLYKKLSIVLVGFFFLFIIQSVKGDYRNQLWNEDINYIEEKVGFFDLVQNRLENIGFYMNSGYINEMNVRLNQGWIISALLYNVPDNLPFAKGETIETAFFSSLLPRLLNPTKAKAGGQENFEKYTGLQLHSFTSMGISILGEAYVNYGVVGGWVFMFLWGLFLSLIYRLLVNTSFRNPILYIFFPLIFLQVVKAETELLVVLNHLVKSMILTFIILWFLKKWFGDRLIVRPKSV